MYFEKVLSHLCSCYGYSHRHGPSDLQPVIGRVEASPDQSGGNRVRKKA